MRMIAIRTCDFVGLTHVNLPMQRCKTIPGNDDAVGRYDGYDKGHISLPFGEKGVILYKKCDTELPCHLLDTVPRVWTGLGTGMCRDGTPASQVYLIYNILHSMSKQF